MMAEKYERRLRALEEKKGNSDDAFVVVILNDGTRRRMLWVDALRGSADVADVISDGDLSELVRMFIC